uniref:Uncharacterized protein n=1 Tax=Solanum lycopersicum TaxID=4081 RepID=A0A3Q7G4R0_SOLLC
MRTDPPSLLSLAIDSALLHISSYSDLSFLPEHILEDLFLTEERKEVGFELFQKRFRYHISTNFNYLDIVVSLFYFSAIHHMLDFQPVNLWQRTLRAGKLNEKILKLFIATGKEEILSLIGAFNIQCVLTPVLPTRCSEKF